MREGVGSRGRWRRNGAIPPGGSATFLDVLVVNQYVPAILTMFVNSKDIKSGSAKCGRFDYERVRLGSSG